MSVYTDRLDAAKLALQNNDPARCTQEIEAFEDLCRRDPPHGIDRELCDKRLKLLNFLAAAAIEGISAAYSDLRDAVTAAGNLTTYGSGGARETRPAHRGLTRRY